MDMDDVSVAVLYHGQVHHANRGIGEALAADFIDVSTESGSITSRYRKGKALDSYDVYVAVNTSALYAGMGARKAHGAKLVYLCCAHRFYYLWNGKVRKPGIEGVARKVLAGPGRPLMKAFFSRHIDGVLAISEFVESYMRPVVGEETPIAVVNYYIEPDTHEALRTVEPDVSSHTAVTVGQHREHKGHDLLIEAWKQVREEFPDATLRMAGSGYPEEYGDVDGVELWGYLDDVSEIYDGASLYVQPSRADAFAISAVEGMAAGVPAAVTSTTGARSAVREVDGSLVTEADPDALAETIITYFRRETAEKERLSAKSREVAERFTPEVREPEFLDAFEQILKKV